MKSAEMNINMKTVKKKVSRKSTNVQSATPNFVKTTVELEGAGSMKTVLRAMKSKANLKTKMKYIKS